jgi:hypothetical protein
VEIPFRCRWAFPGKKCLFDLLQSVLQRVWEDRKKRRQVKEVMLRDYFMDITEK